MIAQEMFRSFEALNVLILGDSMIDAYYYGYVERISPEAPVPIVNVQKKEYRLGGAANVALNIKALGAKPHLFSVIGTDAEGVVLKELMTSEGLDHSGIVEDSSRVTTVKTRVIGNNNQMLRLDEENTGFISLDIEKVMMQRLEQLIPSVDVLIFQDYNKGLLSEALIKDAIALAKKHNVKTVVDPKFHNFFAYKGVDLFKPNRKEIAQAYNIARFKSSEEVLDLAKQLRQDLNAASILITLSEEGAAIVSEDAVVHLEAHPRKIIDVSGAGDSALSAASLCLALNLGDRMIAHIANLAGGLVCERVGVVPIDPQNLFNELQKTT